MDGQYMDVKPNLNIGILAHVDAGKTTLAEAVLYTCGNIRSLGRVDHKDAFLDNFSLERERGITIFSKQANVVWKGRNLTFLDTPGHADFSAEMERTLQVLDIAVLVISATDGVQGHTETLWKLLKRYEVPTVIFVNKMDREDTDREKILRELQKKLSENCVDFSDRSDIDMEGVAACNEELIEKYLEDGEITDEEISDCILDRQLFPCCFGAALRLEGVEGLLDCLTSYAPIIEYGREFAARVFKITRDNAGNRLTHMKITGGLLKAKQVVTNAKSAENDAGTWEEKVDQIRIYNGAKYSTAESVRAGEICAVKGLKNTYAGQGLGDEEENLMPSLVPILLYSVILPPDTDPVVMLGKLKCLEEEIPELHVVWNEVLREIHVQVMGEVQIEVLKSLILDRFGVKAEFGDGNIVYKETITAPVVGIGHYEPLRHYAEVQLLMEPGEPGIGLQFAAHVSEDELDRNWQRLVMTHLEEKAHIGVLTGSEITDMRIVLVAGRAHEKHTEGGDFRQATYRAVRQGLMKAENVLLEPVLSFVMELPDEYAGKAMSDIKRMYGEFEAPVTEDNICIIKGSAPAATIQDYQRELSAYSRGRGRMNLTFKGYEPCHNTEEVIAARGYDPESDSENPSYSVFCSHGAGCAVEWSRVDAYAHTECIFNEKDSDRTEYNHIADKNRSRGKGTTSYITQEEIDEIFAGAYANKKGNNNKYRHYHKSRQMNREPSSPSGEYKYNPPEAKEEYLLVDGYNIIFAWDELRELAEVNIDSARDKLVDILCNYQGCTGIRLILVFDAYKVKNNPGSVTGHNNIYVVYTKEAETADQYIEKTVHDIGHKYNVTVATSDRLEQMIIWGDGATRMSARGLKEAVRTAEDQMREHYLEKGEGMKNRLFEGCNDILKD